MKRLITTALLTVVGIVPAFAADPVPLPGVEVVSEGCSPCSSGEQMVISLRVFRPGVSISQVEVRASIRTPSGATLRLPVSGTVVTLPAGLSSVTILGAVVGSEPGGVYVINGAILNPDTGVTLDRGSMSVVKE